MPSRTIVLVVAWTGRGPDHLVGPEGAVRMMLGKKRRRAVGLAVPALWVLALLAWECSELLPAHVPPLLAVTPALACAVTGRRAGVLLAGACALLALLPMAAGAPEDEGMGGRLLVSGLATLGTLAAGYRIAGRRHLLLRDLGRAREVAAVAQDAVLQAPPPRLAGLALAARYLSAARGAAVGGDLYDAVDTPYGVRLVIGDVRGHGLRAIRTVCAVLGTFREAAYDEKELGGVLGRMERGFARRRLQGTRRGGGDEEGEEFLTLLLVEIRPDGVVSVLNCGHPWPYWLPATGRGDGREGRRTASPRPISEAEPLPPLGLFPLPVPLPEPRRLRLGSGEGLFLCTDGAADARDTRRAFFPLDSVLREAGARADPERTVEDVREALLRHTGGRLGDDVALLAVRRERRPQPLSSDCGHGDVRGAGVPG
ncbi:PP2C family protein-serine/threonine phosphatase [Streptomyces sp. NPDC048172]|uniref:PP2C family protein-serine/threonine phosphatase n=1 Tax=Streptomyces sp. NPDC048172 TaxID=3365505 RepID=UPI0037143E1B